jgi:hypothetical protein
MNFDLSNYEAADTGTLEVMDITGDEPLLGTDGQPVLFEIYGPGSAPAVKHDAEMAQASKTRIFAAVRGKEPKNAAAIERDENIRKLAACTKSISENFPLTAKEIYENHKLGYITRQVAEYQGAWANFPSASPKS